MAIPINQRSLHQQIIVDRSKKPRHQGKTNPVDGYYRGHNPLCGDTIELTLQLNSTGDRIEDVKFEGQGCAIAIASADLMADAVRGKSVEEVVSMVQCFRDMVMGQYEFPQELRKLNVLQGISQFPVRIKCATLSWHTLKAVLESSHLTQHKVVQ
ncbi:MAG TPA: SUF system NifU family Fe-S cluster assembly protein [Cyanobacteria bacterium UBA8803]|nr:SUF system NifU family Fe-S cluster assembly protein [Cyanobacteria bacterium UBA9273]HBL58989.1 SUF system NifU family Fe-S cluster assembly protein [Cyanobacteria bacterium UBA8803]